MNVTTIEMPVSEAKDKLNEYIDGLRDREPTNEDRGIVLGLKALAKGKSLINVADVMKTCPLTQAEKMPKLAVARADWRWCRADFRQNGSGAFGVDRWAPSDDRASVYRRVAFPAGTFSPTLADLRKIGEQNVYASSFRALVPFIPPNLRPYRAIQEYLILFEAEWQPVPPRDPMLLRPLEWPLCVVIAHWDLTELERAVLAGRLTERS